ncbi:HpcH/HpaI aldolase/citrate lyase family protein [Pararhizobium sp. O133]|uniref:HpcH/HpaI aldolase/citrate lyase family protein n=1 Tax=Pararhizobium sp. O133 TaxID=3449278 RepID=UPI003F682BA4
MPPNIADHALFLFVPADRPDRVAKASASGADAIIIDLEDAIAPAAKPMARKSLGDGLAGGLPALPVFVRINGVGTPWHVEDLVAASALDIDGVLLPKAETAADLEAVRANLPSGMAVLAIVESAKGLSNCDAIAEASDRIIFGSLDFAVDIGAKHDREALLMARSRIVLSARLANKPPPIDGVTMAIKDEAIVEDDARYGASLGFAGKLLIHPAQVSPARRGLAPSDDEVAWALRITATAGDGAARAVDGLMIDAPVLARARQIVRAHQRFANGTPT